MKHALLHLYTYMHKHHTYNKHTGFRNQHHTYNTQTRMRVRVHDKWTGGQAGRQFLGKGEEVR